MHPRVLVTVLMLALLVGCVETQQHVDTHTLPTTESIGMPAWAARHSAPAGTPPGNVAAAGPQTTIDGMAVAAPATMAPRGARWQSRTINGSGDPVDRVLQAHGDHVIEHMDLDDAPVIDTLRTLAQTGGFNIVFSEDIGDRTVTLNLRDVTVSTAFHAVLSAAHLGAEASDQGAIAVIPAPGD